MASKNAEPYDACPYCLTEIAVEETSVTTEEEQKPEIKEMKIKEPGIRRTEEKLAGSKAQECAHYFGYLSKRSSKEKIPEDCMICKNIVQCMLMNVTG